MKHIMYEEKYTDEIIFKEGFFGVIYFLYFLKVMKVINFI